MEEKVKKAKKSGFQFTTPKITELQFKSNKDFDPNKNFGIPITYKTRQKETGQFSANISLTMKIGLEESFYPFFILATIEAEFIWDENLNNKTIKELLDRNSIVLLISYLRPLISQTTVNAGYAPLNIPYLDVRDKH